MTEEVERVFIDAHGVDDEAVKEGFRWLLERSAAGGHPRAAVFVPGLRQVDSLGRAIGDRVAATLKKDRVIDTGNGLTIELLIERKLPMSFDGPLLAVWVDDGQLDKLDALRPASICAIPWNRTDVDDWKASWNPTNLRTGEKPRSDEALGNPVVAAALSSLTTAVNLSTGLGHPSDKARAVETFKVLKRAGEQFTPEEVRAWAVQHGWRPDHARDLEDIAGKVLAGRRLQTRGDGRWREDIIDLWRREAAGEE